MGAHNAVDLCLFDPQPDTSWHCKSRNMGPVHQHHVMCLFIMQLLLILDVPTHKGMARLSWPWWLVTKWDGLPTRKELSIV